ncbi:MAG: GNAT family N-acetyltransferase [Spirochaetaceae bacterium]
MTQKNTELKFPTIKTGRLNLREVREDDVSSMMKYLSDKETMLHYDVEPMTNIKSATKLITDFKSRYYKKNGIRWVIEYSETNEIIGDIGFNYFDGWNARTDIGFILRRDFWRQGIISEATEAVIKWVFNDLDFVKINRIEGETTINNIASINTLKKIGFIEEGILREGRNWQNCLVDIRLFSYLRKDFDNKS